MIPHTLDANRATTTAKQVGPLSGLPNSLAKLATQRGKANGPAMTAERKGTVFAFWIADFGHPRESARLRTKGAVFGRAADFWGSLSQMII